MELELTEEILIQDESHACSLINALKKMGFGLSIDDFGTGYSSLNHLKMLEVDRLKIDATFISDINREKNDRTIVEAIVKMGHALGLEVVAEGVETQEQKKLLETMGCDLIQGFCFAKPLPAKEFETRWLKKEPLR